MLRISNLPNLAQEVLVDSMAEVEFILKFTNFRSFWRLLVWDQNIRLNNRYFMVTGEELINSYSSILMYKGSNCILNP